MDEYEFPDDRRYTPEDEWVRIDAPDRVTIGITDYAQQQLGDIAFVELPEVGDLVTQGASFGVVESVKAVSDLYAPVTGEVVDINASLVDTPELLNESCYEEGWIIAIALAEPGQLEKLLSVADYRELVAERGE